MSGRQLLDAGEDRPRSGDIAVPQQGVDRNGIDVGGRVEGLGQGPRRRGEQQFSAAPAEEERFFAQGVADQVDRGRPTEVDDGEGVHAADPPQQPLEAPLFIAVQEHLGVGAGAEAVSRRFQGGAEIGEVVDFPVEGDDDQAIFVLHGLMTGRREVDDGEPAMPQGESRPALQPGVVGAPPGHDVAHPRHALGATGPPSGRKIPQIPHMGSTAPAAPS